MPKPSKELDANTGLFTFMLLNDVEQCKEKTSESIFNPKEWIAKSYLSKFFQNVAEGNASGEEITRMHELMYGQPRGKAEARSKIQSMAAKIKADKNLPKKLWAMAFFRHRQLRDLEDKESIAQEIRDLLIKHFPEDAPESNATKAGQIPNVRTIATRWLREGMKKT